jgi:hypothetical protein
VLPRNRASDCDLTRPIGAILHKGVIMTATGRPQPRRLIPPSHPSAEGCCNRSGRAHCLRRRNAHPMAAQRRLTDPDWPDHADLGRSIAAASGASSWSGQRRFECTRGSPGQRRTSCSARTAPACALRRRPHAQPPLRPVLLEQPQPVHCVETRLTPPDGSREARGAGPSQPRPSYLDLSAPEPSAVEL